MAKAKNKPKIEHIKVKVLKLDFPFNTELRELFYRLKNYQMLQDQIFKPRWGRRLDMPVVKEFVEAKSKAECLFWSAVHNTYPELKGRACKVGQDCIVIMDN